MKAWPTVGVLVLFALASFSYARADEDVLIRAEWRPGGTCEYCFGWRVTVNNNGVVVLEVKTTAGPDAPDEWASRPVFTISKGQIHRLAKGISKARWSELEPEYSASYQIDENHSIVALDMETVVIEARIGTVLRRVEVYGPTVVAGLIWWPDDNHPDRQAGIRFCEVWAKLLDIVGAPNKWQHPDQYR